MKDLFVLMAFASTLANAKPVELMPLNGPVVAAHLRIATQIESLPQDSVAVLKIDSTGGLAEVARRVIIAMTSAQARGVVFECIVTGEAMSAALAIHSYCDKRYALYNTIFLWHSIRGGAPANAQEIKNREEFFEDYNTTLWARFEAYFIDKKIYKQYYDHDGMMFARRLTKHAPGYMRLIRTPYER